MNLNLLKPKRIFSLSLFSAVIFLSGLPSLALTVQEVPNPRQKNGSWVTDMAGILNDETETQINQMISQLEAKNGAEMAVVTVPKTAPAASPREFATELFNKWGIGKKEQNNGVLFLISISDRRVEIETGYGIEAILPDAKVGNIIDTQIIPRFKKADFAGGTLAGTKALIVVLESESPSTNGEQTPLEVATPNQTIPEVQETSNDGTFWESLVSGSGIFALVIGSIIYLKRPRKIAIEPSGYTRKKQGNYIFVCADCQQPMVKVDETIVEPHLSKPKKTAQNIGSVRFEGWGCPHCSQNLTGKGFHLIALESSSSRFRNCPHCQELTVIRTEKTVKQATQYSSGKRLIIDDCQSCSYNHQTEETIPPLPPPPPPPPPSSPSSSSVSSSGSSGSSSGGSSFGGGSSGGGGAGGGW
ncbi:YgcG family protein [Nostoc sp. FACHB-110]|uniref:TPM domain-containing protein n=1 Tax=Nostoc sp. FACHB-110 TaxID=2692834 RepID=UPI00168210DA|nr:TPM domain-containing protein [Nostoc sp. FACHB-110]MBD2439799.1 TPM domain-containing protein [Nostoc sp. FACHB-110]